jgi:hypothetical protein
VKEKGFATLSNATVNIMLQEYLNMKLMLPTLKNKKFILIVFLDFLFGGLYYYYQPLCEPCINDKNCPPCISQEQVIIVWIAIATNAIYIVYLIWRKITSNPHKDGNNKVAGI